MIYFASLNGTKALRQKFKIFNESLELIVDSGASCCIIDKRYVPRHVYIDDSQILDVSGVNGVTKTLGFVETFLEYDFNLYPIKLHVLEMLPSNVIGLIGTNFLNKFEAKIDFKEMTLELKRPKFEGSFMIPARTEIIAYVETKFVETCVVLNEEIQPHVFIGNSIAQPFNGRIPIRMVNAIINQLKF